MYRGSWKTQGKCRTTEIKYMCLVVLMDSIMARLWHFTQLLWAGGWQWVRAAVSSCFELFQTLRQDICVCMEADSLLPGIAILFATNWQCWVKSAFYKYCIFVANNHMNETIFLINIYKETFWQVLLEFERHALRHDFLTVEKYISGRKHMAYLCGYIWEKLILAWPGCLYFKTRLFLGMFLLF